MNSLISNLLEQVDIRAEELFIRFEKYKPNKYQKKLQCCYNCKHTPKCNYDIMDVLDECEEILNKYENGE